MTLSRRLARDGPRRWYLEPCFRANRDVGRRGAWVEFDGISPASMARHLELVQNMKRAELLDRVLLSHDAGWYSVGEPRGGDVRGYDTLFTQFIPALKMAAFSDAEIHQLTVLNPARALSIGVRSR